VLDNQSTSESEAADKQARSKGQQQKKQAADKRPAKEVKAAFHHQVNPTFLFLGF
jgi:hypothetical protein